MARLIKGDNFKEGDLFMRYMDSRLIRNNKNLLSVELGATGSGKSYRDLRKAELWYEYHFKEKFPVENICFGVYEVMKLLSSGKMRRGEVIIIEEAGVNMGSLDFQSKISKMFNYVLQSFRSMNIALFFNLPYLSMLNKSARMLLHYHGESVGIDFEKGLNMCKPFMVQVNQKTGKIYPKYPRVRIGKGYTKVKKVAYSQPAQYLIDAYEKKKQKYLLDLTTEYKDELAKLEKDKIDKMGRKELTNKQQFVLNALLEGKTLTEIAKIMKCSISNVHEIKESVKNKGFKVTYDQNGKDIRDLRVKIPLPPPFT